MPQLFLGNYFLQYQKEWFTNNIFLLVPITARDKPSLLSKPTKLVDGRRKRPLQNSNASNAVDKKQKGI